MPFLEALDRATAPMERGLAYRAQRHGAIAANIANADTPGYHGVDLSFAQALERAGERLATTDPRHLQPVSLSPRDGLVLTGGPTRRDGNDVDVDREMVKLANNQVEYQFLARALSGKFRKLREAIQGRASQ